MTRNLHRLSTGFKMVGHTTQGVFSSITKPHTMEHGGPAPYDPNQAHSRNAMAVWYSIGH